MGILKLYLRLLGWYCLFLVVALSCGAVLEASGYEVGIIFFLLLLATPGLLMKLT